MELINENYLTIVEEGYVNKSDIHKVVYIIDNCITDCHNKYYETFE